MSDNAKSENWKTLLVGAIVTGLVGLVFALVHNLVGFNKDGDPIGRSIVNTSQPPAQVQIPIEPIKSTVESSTSQPIPDIKIYYDRAYSYFQRGDLDDPAIDPTDEART